MKFNSVLLTILALLLCSCSASINPGESRELGPYTVSVISNNIFHVQDYNSSNPAGEVFDADGVKTHFNNCSDIYLLVGAKKALLIDLSNNVTWADNAEESLRRIVSDRIGKRELIITFTHNHGDHTGMLPAYIKDRNVTFALPRIDFSSVLNRFPTDQVLMIDEGYVFDLGGLEVDTVLVPGHTAGSFAFFVKGKSLAFTGDAIGMGHGVWLFDTASFDLYRNAVPHLVSYIDDPANGIDRNAFRFYGGHYWQKDWSDIPEGESFGMEYIDDMAELLDQMAEGTERREPSNLGRPGLETYFRNGQAIIVWSGAAADEYFKR